ncbi:diguanylate cyclase [Mycobacterium sp. 852013-51886_SCH5428379]|uniref:GGDEF domain-containing protein n=1 Tax=Mycobacterium sp. 852013-51886_SCH5428379 TaxID=1834111 RepID=UPI000AECDF02|nr:sensor domain-containing diguanylate cyclase [Mycobacterium sp. 852013-51886_SCH5428379]
MTDRPARDRWRRGRTRMVDLADDVVAQHYGSTVPQLRALLNISHAVMRADFFDEALEVIAEQSLRALGAASLSISRWERDEDILRTLINVGDLGPGEERWPEDETYALAEEAHVKRLLQHGAHYINAIDAPPPLGGSLTVLHRLGKESEVAVAIMHDGAMWGELWASGTDGRRFGPDDVQLIQAIAAHVAVAIGRAELFSTVWRYSYEDPLTQLANRRGLDVHLETLDGDDGRRAVVVCDLDDFKNVNDRYGHAAGDALLRVVADALTAAVRDHPGSVVARLGGDEFCAVLADANRQDAQEVIRRVCAAVDAGAAHRATMTWGVAASQTGTQTGVELIAVADAALIEAKQARDRRSHIEGAELGSVAAAPQDLVSQVVACLDRMRPSSPVQALTCLAEQVAARPDVAAWSIAEITDAGAGERVERAAWGDAAPDRRPVLTVGAGGPRRFVLRLHPAGEPDELAALLPHLRVLAHYCSGFGVGTA